MNSFLLLFQYGKDREVLSANLCVVLELYSIILSWFVFIVYSVLKHMQTSWVYDFMTGTVPQLVFSDGTFFFFIIASPFKDNIIYLYVRMW